jgi:hypothetical protein
VGTLWIIAAAAAALAVVIALYEFVLWMAARDTSRARIPEYSDAHPEALEEREPAGVR